MQVLENPWGSALGDVAEAFGKIGGQRLKKHLLSQDLARLQKSIQTQQLSPLQIASKLATSPYMTPEMFSYFTPYVQMEAARQAGIRSETGPGGPLGGLTPEAVLGGSDVSQQPMLSQQQQQPQAQGNFAQQLQPQLQRQQQPQVVQQTGQQKQFAPDVMRQDVTAQPQQQPVRQPGVAQPQAEVSPESYLSRYEKPLPTSVTSPQEINDLRRGIQIPTSTDKYRLKQAYKAQNPYLSDEAAEARANTDVENYVQRQNQQLANIANRSGVYEPYKAEMVRRLHTMLNIPTATKVGEAAGISEALLSRVDGSILQMGMDRLVSQAVEGGDPNKLAAEISQDIASLSQTRTRMSSLGSSHWFTKDSKGWLDSLKSGRQLYSKFGSEGLKRYQADLQATNGLTPGMAAAFAFPPSTDDERATLKLANKIPFRKYKAGEFINQSVTGLEGEGKTAPLYPKEMSDLLAQQYASKWKGDSSIQSLMYLARYYGFDEQQLLSALRQIDSSNPNMMNERQKQELINSVPVTSNLNDLGAYIMGRGDQRLGLFQVLRQKKG